MNMKEEKGLGHLKQERLLNIVATLTIDTRKKTNKIDERLPVCVRISQNRKSIYFRTGFLVTVGEWDELRHATGRGVIDKEESTWGKKQKQINLFDNIWKKVVELSNDGCFSFDALKKRVKNKQDDKTFLKLWESVASARKLGTAESYRTAAKCFEKLVGDIGFEDVTEETLERWRGAMLNESYSLTTVGIYMRACRVVINVAIDKRLIDSRRYPFGKGKIEIKKGSTRKQEYLPVSDMKCLYDFLLSEQELPKSWTKGYKLAVLRSVAIFLAAYLGNGMNLADLARLEYNDYYFSTSKSFFRFLRTKTKDKADNQSEVIVPIVPELRIIIDKYGSEEKRGSRVFGYILGDVTEETQIRKLIAQENSNIKDRLEKVCELLRMPQRPTMTWTRHSFASNLTHAGVPERYISQAMGHSTSGSVTANYISEFPREKMMYYNSLLLGESVEEKEVYPKKSIRDELKDMPKEELLLMFAELMNLKD